MRNLLIFLFLLGLTSCLSKKPGLERIWIFDIAEFPGEARGSGDKGRQLLFSPETFLNIQKDGHYSAYFGKYEQGEWQRKDSVLQLKTSGQDPLYFIIRQMGKTMQLYYPDRGALYSFNGFRPAFRSSEDNPFLYTNNRWREKATHRETDEEITQRIKNHFHFYEKFFAWADTLNVESIRVNDIPGPLRLYGNGFELIHWTQQPYEWQNHFYDTADVRRAYLKIFYFFRDHDLNWNTKAGRFSMFREAFGEMARRIE